jgi:hypothetical protein
MELISVSIAGRRLSYWMPKFVTFASYQGMNSRLLMTAGLPLRLAEALTKAGLYRDLGGLSPQAILILAMW